MSIGLRHMPVADTTKYYIVQNFENWRSLTSWGKHPWCLPALITAEQGRAGRSMAAHLCAVHLDH